MKRKVLNWHSISDALGRPAWLGVFECGHLWQMEGATPAQLPTLGECGVCQAELVGTPLEPGGEPVKAPRPSTMPSSS